MNDSPNMLIAEKELFSGHKNRIIIALTAIILAAVTIASLFLLPEEIGFWQHVNTHTYEYVDATKQVGPSRELHPLAALSEVGVRVQNNGNIHSVTYSEEKERNGILTLLRDIKVVDSPRKERSLEDSAYTVVLHCDCHSEQSICFNSKFSEVWIITDKASVPAFKIKNTSAFKEYLEELFE